jgi:hypothetical protein
MANKECFRSNTFDDIHCSSRHTSTFRWTLPLTLGTMLGYCFRPAETAQHVYRVRARV